MEKAPLTDSRRLGKRKDTRSELFLKQATVAVQADGLVCAATEMHSLPLALDPRKNSDVL